MLKSARSLRGGQQISRTNKNLNAKRIPITGIFVTALLLAGGAYFLFQSRGPAAPSSAPAARRGGQVVASVRGEPRSFNRFVVSDLTSVLVSDLTQGRLVRLNRNTYELDPWLADQRDPTLLEPGGEFAGRLPGLRVIRLDDNAYGFYLFCCHHLRE